MNPNTRLSRLNEKRDKLRRKMYEQIQAGNLLDSSRTMAAIKILDTEIKEAESYLPKKLSELFDRKTLNESGINLAIIKVHLAADFLADCSYELKDKFDKLGVQENHLLPLLDEIKEKAQAFANIVCHPEFAGLSDFMVTNEKFIGDMHIITKRYIDDHLTITND